MVQTGESNFSFVRQNDLTNWLSRTICRDCRSHHWEQPRSGGCTKHRCSFADRFSLPSWHSILPFFYTLVSNIEPEKVPRDSTAQPLGIRLVCGRDASVLFWFIDAAVVVSLAPKRDNAGALPRG
jgi:hypothetical protein